jgi:hypothetical protein
MPMLCWVIHQLCNVVHDVGYFIIRSVQPILMCHHPDFHCFLILILYTLWLLNWFYGSGPWSVGPQPLKMTHIYGSGLWSMVPQPLKMTHIYGSGPWSMVPQPLKMTHIYGSGPWSMVPQSPKMTHIYGSGLWSMVLSLSKSATFMVQVKILMVKMVKCLNAQFNQ